MAQPLGQGDVFMMIASCSKIIKDPELANQTQPVGHKNSDINLTTEVMNQGLKGIEKDIQNYKNFKIDNKVPKLLLHSAKLSDLQEKKNILNKIGEHFKSGKRRVYLIYTGHGHENGDWKIETTQNQDGDRITLYQIIYLWNTNKQEQANLIIYIDSCYSGQWCYRIVQQKKITSISIIASSSYDQKSNTFSQGSLLCKLLFEPDADIVDNINLIKKYQNPKFFIKGEYFVVNPTDKQLKTARSFAEVNTIIGQPIDYESFEWWIDQKPFQLANRNGNNNEQQFQSTYTDKNGDIYDGAWKKRANQNNVQQFVKQGRGIMKYANGSTYKGEWKNNVRHGSGIFLFVNDEGKPAGKYDGQWQNDLPNGYGIHYYSNDGSYRYEGKWRDAKRFGGKLFYNNQEVIFKGKQ